MHSAKLSRLSADAAGRLVLTCSDDKTARLWDLASGRPVRILRPPIDKGNEGKIYSCALSPDGTIAAVGGWTGYAWNQSNTVYFFDTGSGRITRTFDGIPNVINHLEFSSDGAFLAASLGGGRGVRIMDPKTGNVVFTDEEYDADSYGLSWAGDKHLAVSAYDGRVRLYEYAGGKFRKKTEIKAPSGTSAYGLAFSPDGSKLLLGYGRDPGIELLDGRTLSLIRSLKQPDDPDDEYFVTVAWSRDGKTAWAAGTRGSPEVVREYSGSRFDSVRDTPTARDTILSLFPLPDGMLAGSASAAWGVVRNGSWTEKGVSPIADYRNQQEKFLLADQGRTVQFGFKIYGEDPWYFDLSSRMLVQGTAVEAIPARTEDLAVKDWKSRYGPTLDGKDLGLDNTEISRCLAIRPDGSGFVLGTGWRIRAYDRTGEPAWNVPVPGTVWDINISDDGRLLVASFGDGTIRWYDSQNGNELLAFFPHADTRRWVLWTPSGYFDCSPGGEDLIGWHVNRGMSSGADFFPVGRFRDTYYRPDVVDLVLVTRDETAALARADRARGSRSSGSASVAAALPPVIDLLSPGLVSTDNDSLTIRYQVRTPPDSPVSSVRARVDGQSVDAKGLVPARDRSEGDATFTVPLPKRDCEIQLFAENRHGISVPATVRVTWTGRKSGSDFEIQPKLYLLSIGVGEYDDKEIPRLAMAAKDARDVAAAFLRQKGKLYRDVEARILTDAKATKDDILDGLEWLEKTGTQHDVCILFLSGHGLNDPSMGYCYLPVNADPDRMKRTALSMSDIRTTLSSLPGKAVFFLDTCHSGNVLGPTRRGVGDGINAVINELSSAENGVVVFSSSTGRQFSLESPEWGNGAFTKALVEGLDGKADYRNSGTITFKMLDLWISERVKTLTKGAQSPVTQAPVGVPDFPLAVK